MSKVRVLLADDHPNLLETVQNILESTFEIVGRVGDGKSLVEAALKLRPDVIVTDISMPVIDGLEAVKKLKGYGCRSKVVFLSIHSDHEFVRTCFEADAAGYVVKPRMASDLLDAMRAVLAGRIFVSPSLTYQN